MAEIAPSIVSLEFFCKNSVYLRVRLRERFINPRILKNPLVYKIKEKKEGSSEGFPEDEGYEKIN